MQAQEGHKLILPQDRGFVQVRNGNWKWNVLVKGYSWEGCISKHRKDLVD
jgi:hypothetical protein